MTNVQCGQYVVTVPQIVDILIVQPHLPLLKQSHIISGGAEEGYSRGPRFFYNSPCVHHGGLLFWGLKYDSELYM